MDDRVSMQPRGGFQQAVAVHGVGYHRLSAPRANFHEQVWEHWLGADAAGKVPVALVNDALQLGFLVETNKAEFPCWFEWQNFQSGMYAIGLEPSTNHVLGHGFADERGELIRLEHGEKRHYSARLAVLDGAAEISAAEQRIRAIAAPPDNEFPEPSGIWDPIPTRR